MKIILVRHCTTDWNLAHRLQGQTDIPLNEQGKNEAEKMAEILRKFSISKIISSDLKRAAETSEIINKPLGIQLVLDKRLRECAFGSLEGLPSAEAAKLEGRETWDDKYSDYDYKKFGGENRMEVLSRHLSLVQEIKNTGELYLLVGHGRGLNTLLSGLNMEPNLKRGEYRVVEI